MVAWVTRQKAALNLSHACTVAPVPCLSQCHCHQQSRMRWGLAQFPGYSKTAAAPIPVPMHMDTTPYALWKQDGVGWVKAPGAEASPPSSAQSSGHAVPRLPT